MEIEFAQLTAQTNVQKVSENKVANGSEQKPNNEGENFTDIFHAVIEAIKSGDAEGVSGKNLGLGKQEGESKGTEKGLKIDRNREGEQKREAFFSRLSRLVLQAAESNGSVNTGHVKPNSEIKTGAKERADGIGNEALTARETSHAKGDAKITRSMELNIGAEQLQYGTEESIGNGKAGKQRNLPSSEINSVPRGTERGKENVVVIQTGDLTEITGKLNQKRKTDKKGAAEGKNGVLSGTKRGTLTVIDGRKAGDKKNIKRSELIPINRDAEKTAFQKEFVSKEAGVDELQNATDRKDGFFSMKAAENQPFRTNTQTTLSAQDRSSLLKYLRETGNGEIVKQASIVLKNENSGEIRLMLKPERLGNIRITLNLQDNNIVGRIIVENINVKEAFEHNLESLYRAFRQEGFETAGLDVSVGNQQKGEERREMNNPTSVSTAADRAEEHSAETGYSMLDYEGNINLVV